MNMLLQNPRLVAIVEKIKNMNLDQLADHIEMYHLENQVVEIIYKNYTHRRSLVPELYDAMGYLKVRQIFKCKVTSPDSIDQVRRFLIQHMRERENVSTITRTSQTEVNSGHGGSEPGRNEVQESNIGNG